MYSGTKFLTDQMNDIPLDIGKLVLSPTRTYAPVIAQILKSYRSEIHGMVHCSGGGQTKVLHFIDNLHVVKNDLFDIPPLFELIQSESSTPWNEMYKVFNMGHRMEIYIDPAFAKDIISICSSFNLDAKVIGFVESSSKKQLTISSNKGNFKLQMSELGILDKLEQISIRYEEIAKQMVDPEVINDMKRYVKLNREYKDLSEIVTTYKTYKEITENIANAKEIIQNEDDQEFKALAKEELDEFISKKTELDEKIKMAFDSQRSK